MELNLFRFQYPSRKSVIKIYPIGDMHNGTTAHDRNCFVRLIEQIRIDPMALWIGMGDMNECITWHDIKRFNPGVISKDLRDDLPNIMKRQVQETVDLLKPIKEKCIGIHQGNHEEAWAKNHCLDPAEEIAEKLEATYLRFSAITHLVFERTNGNTRGKRNMYKLFSSHGSGGGRTLGGKVKKLEDLMRIARTDMYLMGHAHKVISFKETVLDSTWQRGDKKPKLQEVKIVAAITGSFYKTYIDGTTTYGERALYAPSAIGSIRFDIIPDKNEVNATI